MTLERVFVGPVCDLKIKGLDAYADQLAGGLDGIYKIAGCFNGRPKYVRQKSPEGGATPNQCSAARSVSYAACSPCASNVSQTPLRMYF
jgi:hypothetical protein